jgi:RNA polymerase sigma-70 factor (ECF subfamily)
VLSKIRHRHSIGLQYTFAGIIVSTPKNQILNIGQDDTMLWKAFQQKEFAAERIVFNSLFRSLCLYAEQITQHQGQAEDIVTDSMIAAFDSRDQFVEKENLKRYLYRAVRNASINYITQYKTRSDIHERILYLQQQDISDNDPVESEVMRSEIMQEIYREIELLPGQCRRIFSMIFIQGRTYEEIADKLNINIQTVRSQKSRALELLRTRLLKLSMVEMVVLLLGWLSAFNA